MRKTMLGLALALVPFGSAFAADDPHSCTQLYPPALLAKGVSGTTHLAFIITTYGKVRNVHVAESSGNPYLDDAALQCARTWRYNPAQKDGQTVEVPWAANVVWDANSANASN